MLILQIFIISIFQFPNYEGYTHLDTKTSLQGIVNTVSKDRGTTYVIMDSGQKYFIAHSRNHEYTTAWFNDFIQAKDQLTKKAYSDTLLIKRSSSVYTFVIGEFLNEHLSTAYRMDLNFAFKVAFMFALFVVMFGSYTRTTVLLTWEKYKIEKSSANNIKNALQLISSGHPKKGIFIFLLAIFFISTVVFFLTLFSFF